MNKVLLTFITLFITASCGIPLPLQQDLVVKDLDAVRQFSQTDPTFASFVQEFELRGRVIMNDGSFSVGDIPINFGDTENPSFQGVCFEYPDGTKEIIVRREWWNNVNDEYKESLLFHELGHCRLGRDHLNDIQKDSTGIDQKVSMMNSVIVQPNSYKDHKEQYQIELYTKNTDELFISLGIPVN
ncbi:MAG: hypothetical protein NXH75_01810 [Halobacteriovoraceae bacterium]|nr:hypothetical protein [Halobacteriovoraceae bacterium]